MKSTKLFNFAFCIVVLFFIGNQQLRAQSILPQLKDKSVSISIVDQNLAIAKEAYDKTPTSSPDYTVIRSKYVILNNLKDLLSKPDWQVNDALIASFGESFNIVYHKDDSVSGNLILAKAWPSEFDEIINLLKI
ncbi:MAG: hypothetical protein IPL98_06415 [Saprospiraceae bacterium]|nr:hypothetical protein [Saprospiraceae bacterium]